MRKQLLLLVILFISCVMVKAQEKRFEGNIQIFSLNDFEDFIQEGYTHIDGDFIFFKRTSGLADLKPPLDEHPDGLNTLVEVTGDVRLDFAFFAPEATQFKRLIKVGGNLEIDTGGKIQLDRLKEVGGTIDISGLEAVVPRLQVIQNAARIAAHTISLARLTEARGLLQLEGGFTANDNSLNLPRLNRAEGIALDNPPATVRFPRLRSVDKSFTAEGFSVNKTSVISLPQLVSVGENIEIGGALDNSGSFNKLDMPRLKTVGGSINSKFSWEFFEPQSWPGLENAENINIQGGAYLMADKLSEVTGNFSQTLRTNLTGQTVTIQYPQLEAVRGDFVIEIPGTNNDRITISEIDLPMLIYAENLNFGSNTYPIAGISIPELSETSSIELGALVVDLSKLQSAVTIRINTEASASISLPQLTQVEDLLIATTDFAPIAKLEAPKLERMARPSLNAKRLIFTSLERFTAQPSITFSNSAIEEADFRALTHLEYLGVISSSLTNTNFSALSQVDLFSVNHASHIDIQFGEIHIDDLQLRDIGSSATLNWESPNLNVNELSIIGVSQTSFQLPVVSAKTTTISNCQLGTSVLSRLSKVGTLSVNTSRFGGSLNLSQLSSANSVTINFTEPTALNLSSLAALGSFGESTDRLSFYNVTDLNLNSLLQVASLSPNEGMSQANSVLKSVSLEKLKTIGSLNLVSDALEEVELAELSLAEQINIKSEKLSALDLSSLTKARTLNVRGSQITDLNLSGLEQIETLDLADLGVSGIDLSALTRAGNLSFSDMAEINSLNLSSLPEMGRLTLSDLPKLETITTIKPGEENGLKATLLADNLFEKTVDITCDNGQKTERTFFPAIREVKLGCETYQVDEDHTSTRPVVEEDFFLIGSGGTAYQFDETISFPSLLVSTGSLSFGELAEDAPQKVLSLEFTNTGQEDINGSVSIESADAASFSLDKAIIGLTTGQKSTLEVTFAPGIVGDHEAILVVQTDTRLEIPLTGAKNGCIEIGGICITANHIFREGEGIFKLSGGVLMNDFLKFSGEVTANTNENSISGNGEVSVTIPAGNNLPFSGENILYRGEFAFNLTDEANKRFASSLQSGANNLLRLANLPISMEDLQFIDNGIQFSASMTLPPQLKNTEVELERVSFTTTEGLELTGEINVPGSIKLGGVSELRDLNFTFDTAENEFSGGATLGTKLFDIEGTVTMRKGGIDDVEVTIIPAKPIPVGPTGWSLTEGTGEIKSIQSPPITLGLSVDMEPTVTAGFDLVKLDDLGLEYTFGKRLKGSGTLTVFNRPVASASLEIRSRNVVLEGNVNFGDFLIGDAVLAVTNTSAGLKLRGALNAKLQIPEGDTFFHQIFDSSIGLPYVIASTEARLSNTAMSGETSLLGHTIAYGVAYVNNDFTFELAQSHALLNQELFGSTGGGTANFTNSLPNRFEGRSVTFRKEKPVTPANGTDISNSAEETEKAFTLTRSLNDIFIRVQHETIMPEFTVIRPDGTEVSKENAETLGALAVDSETTTKQAFMAFKQPEQGEWKIRITSEDAEYAIDIAGADPEPSISFDPFTRDGTMINQSWSLNNVNEDYKVHLLYDDDRQDFNGTEIAVELDHDVTSQSWDISDIETGEYYLYAELENTKTGVIKAFYTEEPIRIVQTGAPAAPTGLTATDNDLDILVEWDAVPEAAEYTLYYEVDQAPGFNSPSVQTDQTSLNLNQLDPGKHYFFAVSAWNAESIEGDLSETVNLSYISESINNAPTLVPVAGSTILANTQYSHSLEATDPENDALTFSLSEAPEGMTLNNMTLNWTPTTDQLGSHTVTAEVSDTQGNFSAISFNLLVEQPNDPPTDISLSNTVIAENNALETVIGSFSATDPDVTDEHSYALVPGVGDADNTRFSIAGNQLIAEEVFDFESASSFSIRVSTTDKAGQSFEKAFQLSIENVNEAPVSLTLSSMEIAENQATGTVTGTLSTEDPDANDSFTYTLVSGDGDTDNASFDISGNSLISAEVFDFETRDSYSIRLASADAGGLTIEKVFMISVSDGPDPMIRLEESSLTFEATALSLSQTLSFTIHNEGDAPLQISSVQNPEGFTTNQTSLTIDAGADAEIEVTFSPVEERIYQGDIIIESNAGHATLAVTGEGAIITSVDDPVLRPEDISIYPNPVHDQFTVDLKKLNGLPGMISIRDANGRTQFSMSVQGKDRLTIDSRQWTKGIYFIRVSTQKGAATKKIIRQ